MYVPNMLGTVRPYAGPGPGQSDVFVSFYGFFGRTNVAEQQQGCDMMEHITEQLLLNPPAAIQHQNTNTAQDNAAMPTYTSQTLPTFILMEKFLHILNIYDFIFLFAASHDTNTQRIQLSVCQYHHTTFILLSLRNIYCSNRLIFLWFWNTRSDLSDRIIVHHMEYIIAL